MNEPTPLKPAEVAPGITVLPSYFPLPGYGFVPVNAFVLDGSEPVLVDTGLTALRSGFLNNLNAVVALADLRWVFLTHVDFDHIGNLDAVLAAARLAPAFVGPDQQAFMRLTSAQMAAEESEPLRPTAYRIRKPRGREGSGPTALTPSRP